MKINLPKLRLGKLSKKSRYLLASLLIFFSIMFFAPLFQSTFTKTSAIPFSTEKTQDEAMELGESRKQQPGVLGEKVTTFEAPRSLFNMLFGMTAEEGKEISSKIAKAPVQEINVSGTRKYQYMLCSTGHYRFFTDEQFKDPNTGFTHKSSDFCAQNNEGKIAQLADSASGSVVAASRPYVPSNCKKSPIPFQTRYQDVSYLNIGESKSYSDGMDGYKVSCSADSSGYKAPDYTISPIDKTVYRGTGATAYSPSPSTPPVPTNNQPTGNAQARQKCTSEYNGVKRKMGASGAGGSSAWFELDRLYQECLNRAGY